MRKAGPRSGTDCAKHLSSHRLNGSVGTEEAKMEEDRARCPDYTFYFH